MVLNHWGQKHAHDSEVRVRMNPRVPCEATMESVKPAWQDGTVEVGSPQQELLILLAEIPQLSAWKSANAFEP